MIDDKREEYRLYSNVGSVVLNWVAPSLVTLVGIILFYLSFARPAPDGPPPALAVFFLLGVAWLWSRQLRMPRRIILHGDGHLEFVSPVRRVVLNAQDIISIKPDMHQFGFLIVRWGSGKLRLLNQFDGFHDLLARIKLVNPAVEIRGC